MSTVPTAPSSENAPIETKVTASATASAVTVLALFAFAQIPGLEVSTWPLAVQAALLVVITAVVTTAAGYLAPHTPR